MRHLASAFHFSAIAVSLAVAPGYAQAQGTRVIEQGVSVTETRIEAGIPGASTTIIDAQEIARSPAQSLPELLATYAGIQARDLYGGTGGAFATVDMRGFGTTATNNTLVLIDGRRISPFDLGAVDFAKIPLDMIERVEIVRGNAAAVLYGDGAIGGAINIITKATARPSTGYSIEGGIGSLGQQLANGSARQTFGDTALSAYGTYLHSDGFRENNTLIERSLVSEARHRTGSGDIYLNVQASAQAQQLPGPRTVSFTTNQFRDDPEGTGSPFDRASQDDQAITLGATHAFSSELELVVDGGLRRRQQDSHFSTAFGFNSVDTEIDVWSLTPRIKRRAPVLGLSGNLIAGIDLYYYDYGSDRRQVFQAAPVNRYDADQTNAAIYAQQTVSIVDGTDLTAGLRVQRSWTAANDRFDPNAPCAFAPCGVQLAPLQKVEDNWAANLGLDQRITNEVTAFGRVGRNFRYPNIDERIGSNLFGVGLPVFDLSTQTSYDAELGGRYEAGRLFVQTSVYAMTIRNEIAFDPISFRNTNFPRTRRLGAELEAGYAILPTLHARGTFTAIDARFDEGVNDNRPLPVVAPYSASGTLAWDVTREIRATGTITYVSEKPLDAYMNNPVVPQIPDYTVVDLRVAGTVFEHWTWSAQVNNLFDQRSYNYGIASAFTVGTYSVFPLPGRTFLARLGAKF